MKCSKSCCRAMLLAAVPIVTGFQSAVNAGVLAIDSFDNRMTVVHTNQTVNPPLFNLVPGTAIDPAVTPRVFGGKNIGDLQQVTTNGGPGWYVRVSTPAGVPTANYEGWQRTGGAQRYFGRSGISFSDRPQSGNAIFLNQSDGNAIAGNPVSDGLNTDLVTPRSSTAGIVVRRANGIASTPVLGANSTFYASMLAVGPETTMNTAGMGIQFSVNPVNTSTLAPIATPKFTSPLITPSQIASSNYGLTGINRNVVDFDFADLGAYASGDTHPTGAAVGSSFLLEGTAYLIITKFANVNPTTPNTSESITWILTPANYDAIKMGTIDEAALDANNVLRTAVSGQQFDFGAGEYFGVRSTGVNSMYLVNTPGQPTPWVPFIDEVMLSDSLSSAVIVPEPTSVVSIIGAVMLSLNRRRRI